MDTYFLHTIIFHRNGRLVRTDAWSVEAPSSFLTEHSMREYMAKCDRWLADDDCQYTFLGRVMGTDRADVIARAKELIDLHTALES